MAKLAAYAKRLGISYVTAYRWFRAGQIQGAYQTPSGTIIVPDPPDGDADSSRVKTVVYARVSSSEQKGTNLETQAERMVAFAIANGWVVDGVVKEVGSGINDGRVKLQRLLRDPGLRRLVVEHRDRLTRFGFAYLETLAELQGFEIVVANNTLDNDKDDLMSDFTAIITSFCARLYSRRRGQNKAKRIALELELDSDAVDG